MERCFLFILLVYGRYYLNGPAGTFSFGYNFVNVANFLLVKLCVDGYQWEILFPTEIVLSNIYFFCFTKLCVGVLSLSKPRVPRCMYSVGANSTF